MATTTRSTRSTSRPRTRPGGSTRKGKSVPKGKKDAIALLKDDHATVKKLFRRYEGLGENALKAKRDVAERIVKELSVHAAVEEQVVYPVIREINKTAEKMVKHALDEHHEAKDLLTLVDRGDPEKAGFDLLVRQVIDAVTEHIQEEEGDVFPALRKALGRKELVQMADGIKAVKKVAPTRPHRRSPNTPPANMVVGLVAGLVDRARDTGREVVRQRVQR